MSPASPRRYEVRPLNNNVSRELRRIPPSQQRRIQVAINGLEENPRPSGIRQIRPNVYRIRVGDYRVLYQVDDDNRTILVGKVAHRNEATYRDLRRLF